MSVENARINVVRIAVRTIGRGGAEAVPVAVRQYPPPERWFVLDRLLSRRHEPRRSRR